MSTSTPRDDDPNKPVTGYPPHGYPYPPPPQAAQSSYNAYPPNGYPMAQNNYHQSNYPYTAPPPAVYYNNPNPYPAQPYNPRRNTFLRRLIIAMISVFILFGVITFIVWLVLRPVLPEFRVESASVTGFNASAAQFTANWDVGFFVRNPNKKMSIYYDRLEGSVYFRREFLTQTAIAPFGQGTRNETMVTVRFASLGSYVDQITVNQIAGERSRGTVNFNLRLLGWIKFRSGTWRTRMHLMRVMCEDVTVAFTGNLVGGVGALSGGPKKCNVDL